MIVTDIFFYVFGFLCIYIFLYVILGFFFRDSSPEDFQKTLSRSLDIFMAVVVLTIGLTLFFSLPVIGQEPAIITQTIQDQIVLFLENPWSIAIVGIVIVLLYLIIYLFRIPMTPSTKPFTITLLENGSWVLFAILLIQNTVRTFFKIDLVDSFVQYLDDMFSLNPNNPDVLPNNPIHGTLDVNPVHRTLDVNPVHGTLDVNPVHQSNVIVPPSVDTKPTFATVPPNATQNANPNSQSIPTPSPTPNPINQEVFNISGNHFTYEDAPAVCAAYGAELATYDQVEEAYEDGAEWCNYGWSADQMAFFPTQKKTWQELQKNPATAYQCGRPGVNGGYMPDPNITFGVNCYGVKPPMTPNDQMAMQQHQQVLSQPTQPTPLTPEEVAFNEKLQYWKENAAQVLTINGFNENKWSEY
jgi:hypothetical protein